MNAVNKLTSERVTMTTTLTHLDTFTQAYIEAALWSSSDNSNEQGGTPLEQLDVELAEKTIADMAADCAAFREANAEPLAASTLSDEQAGHDFWLTRCGHGAGFWDRKHISDEADKALDELTRDCRAWGNVDLYVGDDGRIYAM